MKYSREPFLSENALLERASPKNCTTNIEPSQKQVLIQKKILRMRKTELDDGIKLH